MQSKKISKYDIFIGELLENLFKLIFAKVNLDHDVSEYYETSDITLETSVSYKTRFDKNRSAITSCDEVFNLSINGLNQVVRLSLCIRIESRPTGYKLYLPFHITSAYPYNYQNRRDKGMIPDNFYYYGTASRDFFLEYKEIQKFGSAPLNCFFQVMKHNKEIITKLIASRILECWNFHVFFNPSSKLDIEKEVDKILEQMKGQ